VLTNLISAEQYKDVTVDNYFEYLQSTSAEDMSKYEAIKNEIKGK
jgi:hypothetical protein